MKFLFKYATRGRKQLFFEILEKYKTFLSNKHQYQFLITMDNDDIEMNNADVKTKLSKENNLIFFYGDHANKIKAINANMNLASPFDILFVISDDMLPIVQNFDQLIAAHMSQYFPDLDGALHYNDGHYGKDVTITLSIMGKKLYDHFGYIYHPSYKSIYCDNEFTDVVKSLNKHQYIPMCIVKHEHKGDQYDKTYICNFKKGRCDEVNYNVRKALGFIK